MYKKSSIFFPYQEAGHDVESLFGPKFKCKDCGAHQIDLSEDLM